MIKEKNVKQPIKIVLMIRLILVFSALALTGITYASPGPGKIDTVVCKADPGQSYALYIPEKANRSASPVIYFFDPHADGSLPLYKYKVLADTYGFILVGSNNSKNGNDWPTTGKIWQALYEDTQNRLKINANRIYTCGLSGGAKVAGYVAIQYPVVKGVIANGAGLPDGVHAADFAFSFTGIAGEGDMNLTELVTISKGLDLTRTRHRMIFFDGKHEWAPANSMDLAFAGLQFDAMQQALIPKDDAFINLYLSKSKKRVALLDQTKQLIKARKECSLSISFLDGLTSGTRWFKEKAASLDNDALYRQQRQKEERLLATEQNTKAEYMQHFQQDDMHYWVTTITSLKEKASSKNASTGMNQRLLAYLSLAFYSFSNRMISSNENAGAGHFVALYKMADPTNPEAWYFSAQLHARSGLAQAAEGDLLKAAALGFRDKKRMRQQPEFQNLSSKIHFTKIEAAMKTLPKNN